MSDQKQIHEDEEAQAALLVLRDKGYSVTEVVTALLRSGPPEGEGGGVPQDN